MYELSIRPWLGEIIALFMAMGLMAIMIIILANANDTYQKDWNLPIALTTLVNTLSTIYRTLLVAIAVEIVCQEKWIWFWSASSAVRPLLHMQYFENASRGLFGAIRLLPIAIRSSPSTFLTLLVIMLSLAVGPFAQQSIRTEYRDRPLSMGRASLPVSHVIDGKSSYFGSSIYAAPDYLSWILRPDGKGALLSAFINSSGNESITPVECSTGNCTFDSWEGGHPSGTKRDITHVSVGACSKCYDMSSMISRSFSVYHANRTTYSLPNGLYVIPDDIRVPWLSVLSSDNLTWADPIVRSTMAKEIRWSFVNFTILTMSVADGQNKTDPMVRPAQPIAASCSLYPCMRAYSAFVRNGQIFEDVVHTTPLYPDVGDGAISVERAEELFETPIYDFLFLSSVQSPCRHDGLVYTMSNMSSATNATPVRLISPDGPPYPSITAPKQCIFRMDNLFRVLLRSFYASEFTSSYCTWGTGQPWQVTCGDSWWLAPFWENKQVSVQTIRDRFSAIALATTNQFRLGLGRAENTPQTVDGTAWERLGYTVFQWKWMLLPISLLVIVAALLAATILRSVRHRGEEMAWKGNLLPLLYYRTLLVGTDGQSLETQDRFENIAGAGDPLMTTRQLNKASQHIPVYLRKGGRCTSVASRSDVSQDSLQDEEADSVSLRALRMADEYEVRGRDQGTQTDLGTFREAETI